MESVSTLNVFNYDDEPKEPQQEMLWLATNTSGAGQSRGRSHLPRRAARCWRRDRVRPELCTSPRLSSVSSLWSAAPSPDVSPNDDCFCRSSSTGPTTPSCSCRVTETVRTRQRLTELLTTHETIRRLCEEIRQQADFHRSWVHTSNIYPLWFLLKEEQ